MSIPTDTPLFHFTRSHTDLTTHIRIDPHRQGAPVPATILGNFMEELGYSPSNGVHAQQLINPTFTRDPNLTPRQQQELVNSGRQLIRLYLSGGDAAVLGRRGVYSPGQTGFSVAVLDDATGQGFPLGWSPIGYANGAGASVGRLGGAIRLQGGRWDADPNRRWPALEDGPAGIRQGVFLPAGRCLGYHGALWVRLTTLDASAAGVVEVGLRRRVATPDGAKQAGECLASTRVPVQGAEWIELPFQLQLAPGQAGPGEPVDFTIRWLPGSDPALHLLVDRAELFPDDAVDGLDPEVIRLAQDWPVPLLRWPGGNFASVYHWRDGVGPVHLRPTLPNPAWGGLEYNLFGTDEFIHFCRLTGAEPQLTVNTGTGYAEEAAAWVEYCNGDASTPMGRLRAQNGRPEPYNVRLWEVGNEVFGFWQGGYHGSDENARRFAQFARAMRAASPIPIELIATGNAFDFATPGPAYDHAHADRRWHDQLLRQAGEDIDYISLHALPSNDYLLDAVSDEAAHNAILAHLTTWENRFLPDLYRKCDGLTRGSRRPPIRLAITEWGPLGAHPNRLVIENFGAVVYAGVFLNLMMRNAARIPIANATGFMHGGCIRKACGVTYFDPQYTAIQQYRPFIGSTPLRVELSGPGYDVTHPADLGAVEQDVPFIDAAACIPAGGQGLLLSITNKHLNQAMDVVLHLPEGFARATVDGSLLAHPDITARANPAQPDRFALQPLHPAPAPDGTLHLSLPPFSTCWLSVHSPEK